MKKLNRKGFTLIELLAVIVIMAIILIVTVPNIIQSINDARTNSIHNLAVSAANTYNTTYSQDQLASDKILGTLPEQINGEWKCIGAINLTDENGTITKSLADILGLSNDLLLNGSTTANENNLFKTDGTVAVDQTYCSSIRINNGGAEVILIAKNGGRFDVAGQQDFAYSEASSANAKK